MKDVMASLPEVIKEYKGYNLLIPTATDVQLNPFYKFHVEEVAVDLSETSGDIFKVGSIDTGRKDDRGNKIYADAFSLSKPWRERNIHKGGAAKELRHSHGSLFSGLFGSGGASGDTYTGDQLGKQYVWYADTSDQKSRI